MTNTKFTISQASRITGKTRNTLRSYITKKESKIRLSAEVGQAGQYLVDASELIRVFGNDLDFEMADQPMKRSPLSNLSNTMGRSHSVDARSHDRTEMELLRQQLDREIGDRQRERARLEKDIDRLHETLEREQENQKQSMLLLENRTNGDSSWEEPLNDLTLKVANFEKRSAEQETNLQKARNHNKYLREQLKKEQSKSMLQRILGRE